MMAPRDIPPFPLQVRGDSEESNNNSTPILRTSIPPRQHGHHLRASADFSSFHSPLAGRSNRPNSEIFLSQIRPNNNPNHGETALLSISHFPV